MRIAILLLLMVAGCGGPSAPFIGTWNGTNITTVSVNGKTAGENGPATIPISEDLATGGLILGDECGTTATVRGSGFSLLRASTCVLPGTASTCRSILNMQSVIGSLRDRTLTIAYEGKVDFDQCPTNGAPFGGTFKITFTGKQ